MMGLLLAVAITHASVIALQPVRDLWLPPRVGPRLHGEETYQPQLSFTFDDTFEYLGTPDGLFRSESFADPTRAIERIAFEGHIVTALASEGHTLYVATTHGEWLSTPAPTLHRSNDHGASFDSIARPLPRIDGEYPVVSQIRAEPGRLIIDAGGALFASRDRGDTWSMLFPDGGNVPPETMRADCLTMFGVVGDRLILGSPDCVFPFPVSDPPRLGSGLIVPFGMGWSFTPEPATAPENWLRVSAIHVLDNRMVFVNAGGQMIRSDDGARSFVEVFPGEGHFSAAVLTQLAAAPGFPEILVAGGGSGGVLLICSYDGGWTWRNCTQLALDAGLRWFSGGVSLISGDRAGNTLIVVRNFHAERGMNKFAILKLEVRPPWRRRSVAR